MDRLDTMERQAALWDQYPWFLDLYAALLADPRAARPAIEARLAAADETDPVGAALPLFLAGQQADMTGDPAILVAPRVRVLADSVARRLERALEPTQNDFLDTWVLALWACALRTSNLVLKQADFSRLVGRVKNHAYAHHVRQGGLASSSDRQSLGFDVLLAAVPFGLFDPEDLVLVDAVRQLTDPGRLASASPVERLLLGWYYGEQGSYAKSREIVASAAAGSLSSIVTRRLKSFGQLDTRFIRHSPEGNGNRYEPLLEERFPKLVSDTDEVLVRAVAAPLSEDQPLELLLDGETIPGRFETTHWEFMLPVRSAGSFPSYILRFRDHPEVATEAYRYEVLRRGDGGRIAIEEAAGRRRLRIAPDDRLEPVEVGGIAVEAVSWLASADGTVREISLRLRHEPAGFYGFGERYNALDQAGNRVDQFVYNQYKNQGLRTYIPMPVAYTDRGFGLHLATDSYSWFDLRQPGATMIGVEAGEVVIDLFSGSINEQVAQFLAVTGEPEPVPAWALGPWMSSNNWDNEAEVRRQVELTNTHGVPATVLVIEAWSDEATFYIFNDAQYEERSGSEAFRYGDFTFPEWGRWPDPKGLVEHLHENGLKLILWQIPVIKQAPSLRHAQKHRDEEHFIAEGYGVRHPDGTPLRLPEGWFKDSLLMDFTHPAGTDWWFDKRQYLIDELKVDGFKADGGEMVWGRDLVFADGSTGLVGRNRYPRDYISAYYRFAQQNGGICFSRAGYTGAQTFPAHWAGDERSTWDAFKRSLLAGLSAGMSGVIFWGWDFAGFSGEVPGAELYIRSAQMACFCPIMQYHAESKAEFNQDRTPWNIADRSGDPRALSGYAFYANLRMQLLPYLTREAAHAVKAKTPLMRAMLLDHQDDAEARPLWDQYRLGRDLMVAPVIDEGETSRSVYFPAGRWWHLLQSRWYEPGRREVDAPLEEIPVFVRENTLLPLGFGHDASLGALMPSGVHEPDHLVLLCTGPATYETGAGRVEVAAGGAVTSAGRLAERVTLVFADAPSSVTLNGASVATEAFAIGTERLVSIRLA